MAPAPATPSRLHPKKLHPDSHHCLSHLREFHRTRSVRISCRTKAVSTSIAEPRCGLKRKPAKKRMRSRSARVSICCQMQSLRPTHSCQIFRRLVQPENARYAATRSLAHRHAIARRLIRAASKTKTPSKSWALGILYESAARVRTAKRQSTKWLYRAAATASRRKLDLRAQDWRVRKLETSGCRTLPTRPHW